MKNIQIIDGAENCAYDIFATTDENFNIIFPNNTNIAFIEEVYKKNKKNHKLLDKIFIELQKNPIKKSITQGIHGIIFYELDIKKQYYPTRKDEEAINPDGTNLR